MDRDPDPPWYRAGLRFECSQCGHCCRGPGNVWLGDRDLEALARFSGQSVEQFRAIHVRRSGQRGLVLRQRPNQDCVFWDESLGCQVYVARPRQCCSYPFWKANLMAERHWQAEKDSCPGIGSGALHSRQTIESSLADDGIPAHRTRLRER